MIACIATGDQADRADHVTMRRLGAERTRR